MTTLPAVDEQPLLKVEDVVAANLGLGKNSIYRLVSEGTLRAVKVGRRTLIVNAALRELVGLTR